MTQGMLKMMYPKASKEGIQRMADVHEASEVRVFKKLLQSINNVSFESCIIV